MLFLMGRQRVAKRTAIKQSAESGLNFLFLAVSKSLSFVLREDLMMLDHKA